MADNECQTLLGKQWLVYSQAPDDSGSSPGCSNGEVSRVQRQRHSRARSLLVVEQGMVHVRPYFPCGTQDFGSENTRLALSHGGFFLFLPLFKNPKSLVAIDRDLRSSIRFVFEPKCLLERD
jgi:hypothetical protein